MIISRNLNELEFLSKLNLMRKGIESLSGNLFEPENPNQELLQRDSEGRIVDAEGNIYSAEKPAPKIGELPSEELIQALGIVRQTRPDARPSDEDVQFYVRRLKLAEEEKARRQKLSSRPHKKEK